MTSWVILPAGWLREIRTATHEPAQQTRDGKRRQELDIGVFRCAPNVIERMTRQASVDFGDNG